ncbi:MAG TPA: polyprenyl synthetase family protein [Caldilineaceae bacterium]|nr:polyprenyl synthetase family protein [Caldilineaceae bacterium]
MQQSELDTFSRQWLPEIEREMSHWVHPADPALATHYGMMRYHLGWADEQFRAQTCPAGKRLRPLLCLLACAEVGGDPCQALPAAAAIELFHNFSLIHDDIEDGDECRRHRPTLWKLWGVPQALNAGDGVTMLAFAALQRLQHAVPAESTLAALSLFTQAAIRLTEGQHLDLSFEARSDVTVAEYLHMIEGKTAALIGTSVALGALVGGATQEQVACLQQFGEHLGLAFQMRDDLLGIWGDPAQTGKAAGNDLLRRKKSLPILHALQHEQVGAQLAAYFAHEFGPAQLPAALALLEQSGACHVAETHLRRQHGASLAALRAALGPTPGSRLGALAESLLLRQT